MTDVRSRAAPIIERAPLPIVEVEGSAHTVSYVNAAFCTLLGKTRSDLIGKRFAEIVAGGEECVPILDRVYQTGEAVTHVLDTDADPHPAHWLYAMWPALDADERPTGVIIQLVTAASSRQSALAINEALLIAGLRQHELTESALKLNVQLQTEIGERGKAEAALREVDRRKNEFLAMLAHELRNPLAPIRMAAEIIDMAGSPDPSIRRAREMITRQVDRMVKLVDDLLDVSLIDRGKARLNIERIDLANVVAHAVESCGEIVASRNHRVTMHLQREPPLFVNADAVRVEQVVCNLVINAAKYTPTGGAIHVEAQHEHDMAVVRVRDNGIGIEADMLRPIFDVFTQVENSSARTQGGLGLGLKLVRDLVALHGGTVEATSGGPNQGSEFVVRFPAPSLAGTRPTPVAAKTLVASSNRSILVIDDSADNRESMALMLTMAGHSVTTAENGEDGVEVALRTHPDAALVDIGLPKLNGYEVARQIRESAGGEEILLIALTGYGQDEDKQMALAAGFDAHMTKPADIHQLGVLLGNSRARARAGA
jgi:signal transduction histidine kinase/ActR/RegA family two-component response regulator